MSRSQDHPTPNVELWTSLGDDLWDNIFSRLPLNALALSSCVCRDWRNFTASETLHADHQQKHAQLSWLYINGFKYLVTETHTAPPPPLEPQLTGHLSVFSSPDPEIPTVSWGAGGISYVLSGPDMQKKILYKLGPLEKQWSETPRLKHSRTVPIVGVVKTPRTGSHKVICAGGVLVDGQKESLKFELFSSESKVWEECDDLPSEFKGLATGSSVTAAICNQKFYVFHIHSGLIASFDFEKKHWSEVKTLRPSGVEYCYLLLQYGELVLVGVSTQSKKYVFTGWKVDESTMECVGDSRSLVWHFTRLQNTVVPKDASANTEDSFRPTKRVITKVQLLTHKHGQRVHLILMWCVLLGLSFSVTLLG